jgi:hypothetical protein
VFWTSELLTTTRIGRCCRLRPTAVLGGGVGALGRGGVGAVALPNMSVCKAVLEPIQTSISWCSRFVRLFGFRDCRSCLVKLPKPLPVGKRRGASLPLRKREKGVELN